MIGMNLSDNVQIAKANAATEAGTGLITTDPIDLRGAQGVTFLTSIAVANAGNHISIQHSDTTDTGDFADIDGAQQIALSANQTTWVDIPRPLKRYVRALVTRTASTAVGEIYALLYNNKGVPVTNKVDDGIQGVRVVPAGS